MDQRAFAQHSSISDRQIKGAELKGAAGKESPFSDVFVAIAVAVISPAEQKCFEPSRSLAEPFLAMASNRSFASLPSPNFSANCTVCFTSPHSIFFSPLDDSIQCSSLLSFSTSDCNACFNNLPFWFELMFRNCIISNEVVKYVGDELVVSDVNIKDFLLKCVTLEKVPHLADWT